MKQPPPPPPPLGGLTYWPTVVLSTAVLLAGSGSETPLDTVAELLRVPAAVGMITIVTVADEALVKVPRLQMTIPVPLHVPWLKVEEVNVTPPGKVSVTSTPVAVSGPLLVIVIA